MGQQVDESSVPWINKDFLEKLLSSKNASTVSVSKFDIARAVGKGENYASLLLRVDVEYSQIGEGNKRTSLIIKSLPDGDLLQKFLKEAGSFPKENRLYVETIPAMLKLMKRKLPVSIKEILTPTAFPCERPYTLVLEDLREKKFRMANRHNGLDLKHALLVFRKLAKFHAASVALEREDPSKVERFVESYFVEDKKEMMEQFLPLTYNTLASIVEEWKGFEKYGNKLREFGKKCSEFTIKAFKPSKTFLSVLNHGDCWVNNCMFKYNDVTGDLEDMAFVDLQMTRYASPVLDILYFMFTSVQRQVRVNCYQQLLAEYHSVMNDTLQALGCGDKTFSMEELEDEIRLLEPFSVSAACSVLCAVVADPDEAIELSSLNEEELANGTSNFMEKAMRGHRFREEMQVLLPFFESKGLL